MVATDGGVMLCSLPFGAVPFHQFPRKQPIWAVSSVVERLVYTDAPSIPKPTVLLEQFSTMNLLDGGL